MIINYVREHTRFMEYAADEKITASERLLWYALMHIFNARADGSDWPEDFIRISNDRLLMYVPFDYDTLVKARNGLKQKGRIDYRPGDKRRESPSYRMIYFCPVFIPKKSDNPGGNPGGNAGGNQGGNAGGNPGGNMGDLYININKRVTDNPNQREIEEDDEEEAYNRAREEAMRSWRLCFGTVPTPALVGQIAHAAVFLYHFEPGVTECAIDQAARFGSRNPQSYLMTLMADWNGNGVRTVEDAERYMFFHSALRGMEPAMSPEEAAAEIDRMRERTEG